MDFSLFSYWHARTLPGLKTRRKIKGSAQVGLHVMRASLRRSTSAVFDDFPQSNRCAGRAGSKTWTAQTPLRPASIDFETPLTCNLPFFVELRQ